MINEFPSNRVSFNGGAGGLMARPSGAEMMAAHDHHLGGTPLQMQHEQMASRDNGMRAAVNGGRPAIAATSHAGEFSGRGISASRGEGSQMQHGGGQYPHGGPAYTQGRAPSGGYGHQSGGNERQGGQGRGGEGRAGEDHGRGG